jgi:H+/Cl- antiporter ClcA
MTRRLMPAVVAAGVVGGIVGAAYVAVLHLMEQALWPSHTSLVSHGAVLVAVGVAVAVLIRVLGSPGDVELLVDNIHVLGGPENLRQLRSLIPVSLLCISAGGGLGPEAPLVQTTGALGTWLAGRFRLDRADVRTVTITGMAAGFTVLFGAPLGAAVFALEILHRRGLEYHEALLPAMVGALSGYAVYVTVTRTGMQPVWRLPVAPPLRPADLAWAAACGAAGAIVAIVFTAIGRTLRAGAQRLPLGMAAVIGGVALGGLAWFSPYSLTFGEAQLGHITTTRLAAGALVTAAVAKLLGATVTLASGWRGGFIIPLFFIGAALARAAHAALPGTNEVFLIAGLMAACNVGVTKTPIGSVLVVTEMAGVTLLPTTLIASLIALLLTSRVGLIETQRSR